MLSMSATLISQSEAAKRAGVHRSTIWLWLKKGLLTPHTRKLDGRMYVDAEELARKTAIETPEPEPEPPTEPKREGKL